MRQFEEAIKNLAYELRDSLQQVDEISRLDFNIDISGRVHDGELKIEFSLGSTYNTGGKVDGGSIEAVVKEYLRRFGWDQRNKPLELSFSHPPQVDNPQLPTEEIPF